MSQVQVESGSLTAIPVSTGVERVPTAPMQWYAVGTRYRHERIAQEDLEARCLQVFLPQREILSQWKDRKQRVWMPLFPGYVFVHADLQRSRLDIVRSGGVTRILGCGEHAEPIPDQEIDALKRFMDVTLRHDPYPYIAPGQPVVIQRGPLRGLEGVVLRKKNKFTFVVSVHLIQQSVGVEIDACDVEPTTLTGRSED